MLSGAQVPAILSGSDLNITLAFSDATEMGDFFANNTDTEIAVMVEAADYTAFIGTSGPETEGLSLADVVDDKSNGNIYRTTCGEEFARGAITSITPNVGVLAHIDVGESCPWFGCTPDACSYLWADENGDIDYNEGAFFGSCSRAHVLGLCLCG